MDRDEALDRLRSMNDIVEVVSSYIPLKRAGRNYKANCPFHNEKTPSFIVSPAKQIFHCFGCGAGGNVFTFLMKYENLNFPEAVEKLAERSNFRLPASFSRRKGSSKRDKLFEICDSAFRYYRHNLKDERIGRAVRQYLATRSLNEETVEEFGIGYSTEAWRGLLEHLVKKGFRTEEILRTGLVVRSSKGTIFDLLRGRVIFPIRNVQGKVIAFGGRNLTKELPKYINSPETEIFRKGYELYGLDDAKRHIDPDENRIIIAEGYLDRIRLASAGVRNAVATLGTALTPDHVRLLRRYVQEAVVVFDSDKAGQSAALRGVEVFLEEGLNVKLLTLAEGKDPDDFVRKNGPEAFKELVKSAKDIFDFKLDFLLKKYNRSDSLGLLKITNEMLDTFSRVTNTIVLDSYVKRLSESLEINERSVRFELAKLKKKASGRARYSDTPRTGAEEEKSSGLDAASKEELTILSLFTDDEEFVSKMLDEISPEDFESRGVKEAFSLVRSLARKGEKKIGLSDLLNVIEGENLRNELSRLSFSELSAEEKRQAFSDCKNRIRKRRIEAKLAAIRSNIQKAEQEKDAKGLAGYLEQYRAVLAEGRQQDLVTK